jgi:hypothetical protein
LAVPFSRTERFGFVIVIALLVSGALNVAMRPLVRAVTGIIAAITGTSLPGLF